MYDVNVIGLGYIGLPTAALFASRGLSVRGVDINPRVVDSLRRGKVHIIEPGLQEVVSEVIASGALTVSSDNSRASVFVIAVPTPITASKSPDLSFVFAACDSLAPLLEVGDLLILESTCPVGATNQLSERLQKLRPDLRFPHESDAGNADIGIAYCPERVLPGNVLYELENNDRIIGGISEDCTQKATEFYQQLVRGACLPTTASTAELAKLTENSFRDVNIAFANELSVICGQANIDVQALVRLVNHHPRVNVLQPGPGVGGHCIAVDPWFIVASYPDESKLISQARHTNDNKPLWVLSQIHDRVRSLELELRRKTIKVGVFGLAFKPNIDDVRESPAVFIYKQLRKKGLNVEASEPNLSTFEGADLCDPLQLSQQADLSVFLVAHDQFKPIRPRGSYLDFCGVLQSGNL